MGDSDPDAVDYYSRIGASPDADIETIERQRKQADRRFSPMSTSAEASEKRHMRINEASSVLEDPAERERYDACYDAFGRIDGTAVYETLSTAVLDETFGDAVLENHLEGFVEVLGPVDGARAFESYSSERNRPLSDTIDADALPNGYAVDDARLGVAVWSRHQAGDPCELERWLAGGRTLWRTALVDPGAVDDLLADLPERPVSTAPDTGSEDDGDLFSSEADGDATTARIQGHPSSGTADRPGEYTPADEREESDRVDASVGTLRRFERSLTYIGLTVAWGVGSTVAAAATGLVGTAAGGVVFLPLLAAALLVLSSVGGLNASVEAALGVPLASADAPFATAGLTHYLSMLVAAVVPAALTARLVVPRIDDRKGRGLPRDAWLVFVFALVALTVALFVGVGRRALPRPAGVGLTVLVAAGTFQAARDVGAPRLLSLLCRSVAAGAFGLVSAVAAVGFTWLSLDALAPSVAATYAELLVGLPLVESPLFGIGNAELVAVGFGALAFAPIALTTVYSLSYAVESVVLRFRSRAVG